MSQNQKSKMYAQIEQHGKNLNFIFNTGLEPVKLCKKLRTLEAKAHKVAVDYCNGDNGVTSENIGRFTEPIFKQVNKILNPPFNISFNGDARGYALKISDKIMSKYNLNLYKDWGGYGILAPEFDGN